MFTWRRNYSQVHREAGRKTQREDSRLESTGEAGQILPSRPTEGTKPADTWVLDLPPEPWEGSFWGLPPSLPCSVSAALQTNAPDCTLEPCCAKSFQRGPTVSPHGLWPARLLHLWGSPGRKTGMGSAAVLNHSTAAASPGGFLNTDC